jgi:hypothetical protein
MNSLGEWIAQWIKEALIGGIMGNFENMFAQVNTKVTEIAAQVGQTPESFNSGVFSMIKSLSDTVIIPIAGMVLTFILCYELIQMIIDRNNMHDFETWIFFKWIFKTFCAVYIVTHTFDIVIGVFELAQHVINGSAGIITGSLDAAMSLDALRVTLEGMEWYALLGLYIQSAIIGFAMNALSICIFIIIYGRMLEIYLTTSVAAIPFATMVNREWGQMGQNYLKSLFAVAFQGFLILVCVAIYSVLLQSATTSGDPIGAVWSVMGYTVLLCFSLFKTGSLSKSIFSAH